MLPFIRFCTGTYFSDKDSLHNFISQVLHTRTRVFLFVCLLINVKTAKIGYFCTVFNGFKDHDFLLKLKCCP